MGSKRHTNYLSLPKPLPAGFYEDRRSVYWENNIPAKNYSETTVPALTPRQQELVACKGIHQDHVGDRPSPIWPISNAALKATCTPRLSRLARPKTTHHGYRPCREVRTRIPRGTMSARPSSRVVELARHKTFPPLPIKPRSEWDWGEWEKEISAAALAAVASDRTTTLAQPKTPNSSYRPSREVQWPIAPTTLTHSPSERLQKLSEPKQISGYREDYNSHAWTVSRAALLAQPSPRLDELATPLPRKCRTRK